MPRVVKVAVIGSGLAGLTAAYLLGRQLDRDDVKIEVHLFERSSSLGMDSSSITVEGPDFPQPLRIDVPMRSFQGGYYNQLIKLYKSLGLQFRESDFTYSFSSLSQRKEARSITTEFIYNGASGRAGFGKPAAFGNSTDHNLQGAERKSLQYFARQALNYLNFLIFIFQYALCFLITLYHSLPFLRPSYLEDIIFRDWVDRVAPRSYLSQLAGMDAAWQSYVQMVLVPVFSGICTTPAIDIMNHPMEEFLDYIWLTFGRSHHYVIVGGVCKVVDRLQEGLKHINTSSTILSIQPDLQDPTCVSLTVSSNGETTEHYGFNHIVFATQAPIAASILTTYLNSLLDTLAHRKEKVLHLIQCLKTFETRPSVVINHTDDSLLPDHDRDIRELNLISAVSGKYSAPESKSTPLYEVPETYTMTTQVPRGPREYTRGQPRVFQTTNPIISPRKDSIMSVAKFHRAMVTKESKKALGLLSEKGSSKWWQCPYQAQMRLGPLQGCRPLSEPAAPGIWVCGAFAHSGIPLLEGSVISARNVVEQGILEAEGIKWREEPWNGEIDL